MATIHLSDYFEGAVAKRLSPVEVNPKVSNQHEFNGVSLLKKLLGETRLTNCPARFVWIGTDEEKLSDDSFVTWYDARENDPKRSEYRLYFHGNPIMERAREGDLLIVGKRPDHRLMVIVVAKDENAESQLLWLFGIPDQLGAGFEYRPIDEHNDIRLRLAARYILGELGIDTKESNNEELDALLAQFSGSFPKTRLFSEFARRTGPETDPREDPDGALLSWMEWEIQLFSRLEQRLVGEKACDLFDNDGKIDVKEFLDYSLSVHNRRKSRAGHALEHHLEEIFNVCGLRFDRNAVTEGKKKPDFLFPGQTEYHDRSFPTEKLTILGVKSTCKDRWRQVLSEATRVPNKHLLTLEPRISKYQTSEMKASHLQLVLPKELHSTFMEEQQEGLMGIRSFIDMIIMKQAS